jgi:oligopeptidase A
LTTPTENPLLATAGLPDFAAIRPDQVAPAIEATLAQQRERLRRLEAAEASTFEWALELERIQDVVHRVWEPVAHLNAVRSSPELRDAYNQCLPLMTEFWLELGQSEKLHAGFERLHGAADAADEGRRRLIENALRDFRLAGVALDLERRARFSVVSKELVGLQARFEQNVMDATDAFRHHVTDEAELDGMPAVFVERARRAANEAGLDGFLLTLDPPTYMAVISQADAEALRATFYEAWVTRASDQGPQAGRWNNAPLMGTILALRHESARLLGFANFAELSLATKMAGSPDAVIDFLRDLAARCKPVAARELTELENYAGRKLAAWDVPYFAERLKRERLQLSAETLRPYFPLPKVLDGLFSIVHALFTVEIRATPTGALWHPDVCRYELYDEHGRRIGSVLTDLYARPNKRGGAWMDGAQTRARIPELDQLPIAYLVCNFNPPDERHPSLLTHDEVVTLFHEFGHALHHLLTEIDYPSIAGIHGVPWDAVEFPSQFFENYAWLPEALPWISSHYETGQSLPQEKLETLRASRRFHAGLAIVRQLEFALFDFRLHKEYDPRSGDRVSEILTDVRREVAVVETPGFNRFPNTFSHIFGGGYAAGYYSYKWAEVLAADAFAAFVEQGTFSRETAARFRRCILASGGSRDALEAFTEFRGRAPSLEPLLRQAGIGNGLGAT